MLISDIQVSSNTSHHNMMNTVSQQSDRASLNVFNTQQLRIASNCRKKYMKIFRYFYRRASADIRRNSSKHVPRSGYYDKTSGYEMYSITITSACAEKWRRSSNISRGTAREFEETTNYVIWQKTGKDNSSDDNDRALDWDPQPSVF